MLVTRKIIPRLVVTYYLCLRCVHLLIHSVKSELLIVVPVKHTSNDPNSDSPVLYKPHSNNAVAENLAAASQLSISYSTSSIKQRLILSQSQTGFTLVEIMVVVVILSIFAGMMSLSVGTSDSRKNRAFYEHLTDSLSYVRLLSAERMQPMGLSLQADKQGQVTPVIVTLSNPYISYQQAANPTNDSAKNSMELSADISGLSGSANEQAPTPSWTVDPEVSLPSMPVGVSLSIESLESVNSSNEEGRVLQPWFTGQTVPQVLWFGTGQATPVTIEVRHDSRLVGEVITILPDGSMTSGQESL